MAHYIKIPSMHSDLFIRKITDVVIEYEVRDKDTGMLLEPRKISSYKTNGSTAEFDGRTLNTKMLEHCRMLLEA